MPTEDQTDDGYEYLSFTEVKNTIDLILLYIDINKKVIDTKKSEIIEQNMDQYYLSNQPHGSRV